MPIRKNQAEGKNKEEQVRGKTKQRRKEHHSPEQVRWKVRSWAVLAGGSASCCHRAIHSDRRGKTEEEEEEDKEEEGGKPALLSYRRRKNG